jgi:putative protease
LQNQVEPVAKLEVLQPACLVYNLPMAIELLVPAKNLDQGLLALRCGADAVYMGGPRFGARKGAANEMSAVERLVEEAHLLRSKVYLTLNTIIFEDELELAHKAAWDAYNAGVDALIIQDMAFLEMDLPDIPLHASTQAVCDSPEKVAFLASIGFSRAILARELTLSQISAIKDSADIELEAFIYGALCVSESGHCYLSQAICGRSGNRGNCSQPCRRDWTLTDANGRTLIKDIPLLSIKDLDLSNHIERLVNVGVTSFKIEGRLKDADYIKNVVTYLRRRIDALMTARPDLSRASHGRVECSFVPNPAKTFHRGFTAYQMEDGRQSISSIPSSGHLGEIVGVVESISDDQLVLDRYHSLRPGDGLALPGPSGRIVGTVVNAVQGQEVVVQSSSGIELGHDVFRNYDHAWHKALRIAKVERRIRVDALLDFPDNKARLRIIDEDGCSVEILSEELSETLKKVDVFLSKAKEAISHMGQTAFVLRECQIEATNFLPLSRLNAMRWQALDRLTQKRVSFYHRLGRRHLDAGPKPLPTKKLSYRWNVSNSLARAFYKRHGATQIEQAFELEPRDFADNQQPNEITMKLRGLATPPSNTDKLLMNTVLCLKFELGWCPVHPNERPLKDITDPGTNLFLKNGSVTLRCQFDCKACRMQLYG